jgi:beta-apo-4'-carotenal oxygenase
LTFGPVIGAIAAGNTVVIKPSEIAPRSAAVIQQIVETSLDPSCYTVIQGGIPETKELLAQHWDKIFFTGSAKVGRIVATAAASHLTPTVLELGGVNPAIISKNANPRLVVRRMLWGKILNAGQTCTSQNYLLVERPILSAVVEEFKMAYKEFYPYGAKGSPDYARIINKAAFDRLRALLDECSGTILMGGDMDEGDLFVEPTLIQIHSPNDPILSNETFGPIIPILRVEHLDEAVEIANEIQNTPLGLYPFGTKAEIERGRFIERSLHSSI